MDRSLPRTFFKASWSYHRVIERASNGPQSDETSAPDGTGFGAANLSDNHGFALRRRDLVTLPKSGETRCSMAFETRLRCYEVAELIKTNEQRP
jgi:hypothetical protein